MKALLSELEAGMTLVRVRRDTKGKWTFDFLPFVEGAELLVTGGLPAAQRAAYRRALKELYDATAYLQNSKSWSGPSEPPRVLFGEPPFDAPKKRKARPR